MNITVDEIEEQVTIDGVTIEGQVWKEFPCPTCGGAAVLHAAYDATMCPRCNVWFEPEREACGDPKCEFCSWYRPLPERPLPLSRTRVTGSGA
jgi:hypothetical protein